MFGGYYLGQIYLGESGIYVGNSLIISNSIHTISSSEVSIVQDIRLIINNSVHTDVSDIVSIIQHAALNPDVSIIRISSDTVAIIEHKTLSPINSIHSIKSSETLKIINWTELGVDFGIYLRDFYESGSITTKTIEDGIIDKKYNNIGSIEPVTTENTGTYDVKYNKKGIF